MGTPKRIYKTIQIDENIKTQIVQYCDSKHLKIGGFIEQLFCDFISGSLKTQSTV